MHRAAVILILLTSAAPLAAQETVGWRDAAQCVGRVCAVRGSVAATQDDGPVIRLYFDAERRDIYATLVRGWLVTWPDYSGHEIVVSGPVDRFHDAVEIMLDDPDDVTVLDATPPTPEPHPTVAVAPAPAIPPPDAPRTAPPAPTGTATRVAPPAATPGEVERLRERVHELEDRVRELEPRPSP
jgi:hypothetical protein